MAAAQPDTRPSFARNPLSIFGAWLTSFGAIAFISYYVIDQLGLLESPYAGLFGFGLVPVIFLIGLLLIPVGIWREARRRERGTAPWRWPAIDLGGSHTRRVLAAITVLTMVNLAIVAVAGLGAVHYTESDRFCGQVCHEPMRPEFTAHQLAPHANVGCVQCHVGPGASGTVRAKLNGTRQLYQLLTGTFERPIPSPARNLPVAADTCARCHSPGYPQRDITRVIREYDDDEANTEKVTTIVLFTGRNHWHARPDVRVDYVTTDVKREKIPYVKVSEPGGNVTEYFAENVTSPPSGTTRHMDCLDCHSRPAHRFSSSAERAVDDTIGAGEVSRTLPYIHREMVAALKAEYRDDTGAAEGIRARLADFYAKSRAEPADVTRAIAATQRLYRLNVFPQMKVTWGTYGSQISHSEPLGCFRCHDDEHKSKEGKVIRQDCELCHRVD